MPHYIALIHKDTDSTYGSRFRTCQGSSRLPTRSMRPCENAEFQGNAAGAMFATVPFRAIAAAAE